MGIWIDLNDKHGINSKLVSEIRKPWFMWYDFEMYNWLKWLMVRGVRKPYIHIKEDAEKLGGNEWMCWNWCESQPTVEI